MAVLWLIPEGGEVGRLPRLGIVVPASDGDIAMKHTICTTNHTHRFWIAGDTAPQLASTGIPQ
jgi:hypothetical protein